MAEIILALSFVSIMLSIMLLLSYILDKLFSLYPKLENKILAKYIGVSESEANDE